MCFRCGGFGHTSKFCAREEKYLSCAGNHSRNSECETSFSCINCKGQHKILDRSCPIYMKNAEIMRRMAFDNLSFLEARRVVALHNITTEVPTQNMKSFPSLPVKDRGGTQNFREAVSRVNSPKAAEEVSKEFWKRLGIAKAPMNLQDFLGILLSKAADILHSDKLFQRLWRTMNLHVIGSNNRS